MYPDKHKEIVTSLMEGKFITIEDLLFEITNNLRSLESQAKKAERYFNIKNEYIEKKRSLKGQPVSSSDTELLSFLQKDIDLAEKVIQLESELKVAKEEIGYLQAFIKKIALIGQSDPNVMTIFQKAMKDIESNK